MGQRPAEQEGKVRLKSACVCVCVCGCVDVGGDESPTATIISSKIGQGEKTETKEI